MASDMAVGTMFESFQDFETKLKAFQKLNGVRFCKKSSKKISTFHPEFQRLQYDYVIYECKRGKRKKSTSKGIRPNQRSVKCDCKAYIRMWHVVKNGMDMLKITGANHNHTNHPLGEATASIDENDELPIWTKESWALGWLTKTDTDPIRAFCTYCQKNLQFSLTHLTTHSRSASHLKNAESFNLNREPTYVIEKVEAIDNEGDQGGDGTHYTGDMWVQEEVVTATSIPPQNIKIAPQTVNYTVTPSFPEVSNPTNTSTTSTSTSQNGHHLPRQTCLPFLSSPCHSNDPLWQRFMAEQFAVKRLERERIQEEMKTQKLIQQYHKLKIKKLLSDKNEKCDTSEKVELTIVQ